MRLYKIITKLKIYPLLKLFPELPKKSNTTTTTTPKKLQLLSSDTVYETRDFAFILNAKVFSDLTIIIPVQNNNNNNNIEFYAHKIILYARCSYFRTMFDSKFKESNNNSITIKDVIPEVFYLLLSYIYTDNIKFDHKLFETTQYGMIHHTLFDSNKITMEDG
eukprot:TRINITY_DN915_c0_g2_i1.p1 TRINITY_DN915_c0_g2~~TRINITY_DN915_c0_g2_i1.p1  ORF type:complete len:170 (+),score=33.17 TRINITY_DN915_c0_g2_i1:23-511(+)